jgi:hypothetical protein
MAALEMTSEIADPHQDALIRQLLAWAADRPRTYGEAMEAWGTFCPGMPVWEDAIDLRLVEVAVERGVRTAEREVRLTNRGRALLDTA